MLLLNGLLLWIPQKDSGFCFDTKSGGVTSNVYLHLNVSREQSVGWKEGTLPSNFRNVDHRVATLGGFVNADSVFSSISVGVVQKGESDRDNSVTHIDHAGCLRPEMLCGLNISAARR